MISNIPRKKKKHVFPGGFPVIALVASISA